MGKSIERYLKAIKIENKGIWASKSPYFLILSISIMTLLLCGQAKADVIAEDVIETLIPIIISAESSGNPNASDGKSFGLMGISDCVLEDWNKQGGQLYSDKDGDTIMEQIAGPEYYNLGDLYNPSINVRVGTWYLHKIQSWLPKKYRESKAHIISAWNNGIGWLKKHNWQPPRSHKNKIYNQVYKEYWKG